MTARKFKLSAPDPWRAVGVLLGLTVVVSLAVAQGLSMAQPAHDFWTYVAWTAALAGGVPLLCMLIGALGSWRRPLPRSVDVGMDGVLVGARFIPYSEINCVEHAQNERTVKHSIQGGVEVEETWYEWTVSIRVGGVPGGGILLGGELIELVMKRSPTVSEDPLGAEIACAIDEALAAWHVGHPGEDLAQDLARGERTGSEWLEALRGLGSGAAASYRRPAVDVEKLSRLLDDPRGKLSARAAAAVVLAELGDTTAPEKLRIAAEARVDRRVRIALENIADETAVAEALEVLEEGEREREGRGQRHPRPKEASVAGGALNHQVDDIPHESDDGEHAHGEADSPPGLLRRQIDDGVQDPRAGEDPEDDLRDPAGAAGEHEDQAQEEEGVDRGLGVAMSAEHAGDLRRIDLHEGGAEPGAVLLVDRGLGLGAGRAAVGPEEQEVEAEHQAGDRVDGEGGVVQPVIHAGLLIPTASVGAVKG